MPQLLGIRGHDIARLSPAQAAEHGVGELDCLVGPKNERIVLNKWNPNQHLGGLVAQARSRRVGTTEGRYIQLVPAELLLTQIDAVDATLESERERLADPEEGELQQLEDQELRLMNWLDLSIDERLAIEDYFADVADTRAGARNPFNIIARDISLVIQRLRNNPTAIRVTTPGLRRELEGRHADIGEKELTNAARRNLYGQWLVAENRAVGATYRAAERVRKTEDLTELGAVKHMAKGITFTVQPINALAAAIRPTRYRLESPEPLVELQAGLGFTRTKKYLGEPTRKLVSTPQRGLDEMTPDTVQQLHQRVQQRLAGLEEMTLPGVYGQLAGRLLLKGSEVMDALGDGELKIARGLSEEFNTLLMRHVSGPDDPAVETWYRWQL